MAPLTGAGSVTNDRLDSIHHKISIPPKILRPSAGNPSCCIFRVHRSLVETNGNAYHPRIISLGPYHLGDPDLSMMQEHKYRYLDAFLFRSQLSLGTLVRSLEPLIGQAVECYSESISLSTDEFLEMLVLDSAFLIELFMRNHSSDSWKDDPLFSMSWVHAFFHRDFLCLENQIPYFVLEKIYDKVTRAVNNSSRPLALLALKFFSKLMCLPGEATASSDNLRPRHLLELVRRTFLPPVTAKPRRGPGVPTHVIHSVSKLRRSGIQLRASKKEDTFLAVQFRVERGLLEMPMITMDDQMGAFLVNCIAYEQCHHETSDHFTAYVTLLDCLVNTAEDVGYMCDRGIIENLLGTDKEVAGLVNNMGKDVTFDFNNCYLSGLFNEVNNYYNNTWHVNWTGFKYTYFDTPWSFISALAALVLLLLTLAQTFFAIYTYFFPRS